MVEKQLGYKYQVYKEKKKGIMTGIYPPGSVMNERKLSEELGGDADARQRWLASDGNL